MRKVSLLMMAALLVGNAGCCGKIKSWFHRGSPCGTRAVAPAVLGAPLAIGSPVAMPMATTPAVVGGPCNCCPAPVCVDPCPPCCPTDCCPDPCQGGWTTGYGGYVDGGECAGCSGGGVVSDGYMQEYSAPTESRGDASGRYGDDPRPGADE